MDRGPHVRASDADRERVAEALREHCATGRIGLEEFQERLDACYQARTYGELDKLLADLPTSRYDDLPVPASAEYREPARRTAWVPAVSAAERHAWRAWLQVSIMCWGIWAVVFVASGFDSLAGLWPIWVSGPWGVVLLARTLTGGPDGGDAAARSRHDRAYVERRTARRVERSQRRTTRRHP